MGKAGIWHPGWNLSQSVQVRERLEGEAPECWLQGSTHSSVHLRISLSGIQGVPGPLVAAEGRGAGQTQPLSYWGHTYGHDGP